MIDRLVQRILVQSTKIVIELKESSSSQRSNEPLPPLEIPWSQRKKNGLAEISEPTEANVGVTSQGQTKPELVQAIVRAHLWLKQLQDGTYRSIEELGRAGKVHSKNVRIGLRLAFLAPGITRAIVTGSPLSGKTSATLSNTADALSWHDQTRL